MKYGFACTAVLVVLTACTSQQRSPDAIREQTAHATSEATRDAKAVVQGVYDGLKEGGAININKASADRLETLPGIDADAARRIIERRPYGASYDMVKRHAITKSEYDRIASKVTAK